MRTTTLLAAISLLLVPGVALAETCRAHGYPVVMSEGYDHTRWIDTTHHPQGDIIFKFAGFTSLFDGADDDNNSATPNLLEQPEWVSQEVKRYVKDGMFEYADGFKRPSKWYELSDFANVASEPGVTDLPLDRSYSGEGTIWNRGHMATRNLVNRLSAEAGCNTHNFANAVPQFWSLNQGEWLALENYTGALANEYGEAWAISGPIFLPNLKVETIGGAGETKIPIPHALFKVIVFEVDSDIYVRAFMFPQPSYERVKAIMATNGGKPPLMGFRLCRTTDQDAYDFAPYVTSLHEIESDTGITFFPDATPSEKDALNSFSSRGIWKVDRRFFEKPCGAG